MISKTAQFLYLISSWNLLILPQIEQGCVQFWWTIILNWRLKLKYCVVLELGGTSTLQAAWRAEVPPLRTLKWGDFRFPGMAAWKVEDPPLPQFAICYLLTLGSTSIQHSVFIYSVLNMWSRWSALSTRRRPSPSRGLLRDYEPSDGPSFQALGHTLIQRGARTPELWFILRHVAAAFRRESPGSLLSQHLNFMAFKHFVSVQPWSRGICNKSYSLQYLARHLDMYPCAVLSSAGRIYESSEAGSIFSWSLCLWGARYLGQLLV